MSQQLKLPFDDPEVDYKAKIEAKLVELSAKKYHSVCTAIWEAYQGCPANESYEDLWEDIKHL